MLELSNSTPADRTRPAITTALCDPAGGLAIHQVRAFAPGVGEIELLATPGLDAAGTPLPAVEAVARPPVAGAFLVPFANRVRRALAPDGRTDAP